MQFEMLISMQIFLVEHLISYAFLNDMQVQNVLPKILGFYFGMRKLQYF